MRARVYIAGPYTSPDPVINTNIAFRWWHKLWAAGFAPFCPHVSHFLHLLNPLPYEQWLDYDNEWVVACRAMFRFAGKSSGADKEEALARASDIPIFYEEDDGWNKLIAWGQAEGITTNDVRLEVFRMVGLEREYQDRKWGGAANDDIHEPEDWVSWINEYANGTGRAAQYSHEVRMVKVAALGFAALEQIGRTQPNLFATLLAGFVARCLAKTK